jgi:ATP-binding cassette subfamily B multidrug efflux pump
VEEEISGKFYDGRLIRRLLGYLWPYRTAVALALLCIIVHAIVDVSGPLLTKFAIDRYLSPQPGVEAGFLTPYLSADPWTGLTQVAALYLVTLLISLVSEFGQACLMNRAGHLAMFDLRHQTMEHLQRLDVAHYDKTPVGRMLTRVTSDADALAGLFTSGLVTLLGDILMLSLVLIVMLKLSFSLTCILLLALPFVIGVTVKFRRDVTKSNRRIRTAVAKINSYLQEHLSGIAVLQLFNREARSRQEFSAVNREHMTAFKDAIVAYGWFYPAVEFCGMFTVAALLAWGGHRISDGTLSLGVLVAFFQYGIRFFRPIQDLSEKYNILQSAAAAAERIFQTLDTPVSINVRNPQPLAHTPALVEFDRVSFRVEPGETIAVVGHTGAGKTTLTNLLLRFYDIQQGTIRIGGIDIRDIPLDELRRRFAVVLQDSFLFTGSIADNIRLGTERISDASIETAVEQVNLKPFIASLPDGLNHQVRERGAGVSTGQKQLVSFARALAHDPLFLILDEATSSVDTDTELRIRAALDRLIEGRTSLIIAHRLSTIQRASRILVLHKGQLRESGSHQELLAARGIYWRLYQLQYA